MACNRMIIMTCMIFQLSNIAEMLQLSSSPPSMIDTVMDIQSVTKYWIVPGRMQLVPISLGSLDV